MAAGGADGPDVTRRIWPVDDRSVRFAESRALGFVDDRSIRYQSVQAVFEDVADLFLINAAGDFFLINAAGDKLELT